MIFKTVAVLLFAVTLTYSSPEISDSELDRILDESINLFKSPEKISTVNKRNDAVRLYRKGVRPEVEASGQQAGAFSHASTVLSQKYNISFERAQQRLEARATARPNFDANSICGRTFTCNAPYPYRTLDGVCNNLQSPGSGMAVSRFERILAAEYDDGTQSMRQTSVTGSQLWSPRIVSLLCHNDTNVPNNQVTHMVVFFGQFIDHDMTSTPEFQNFQCCQNPTLPQCMPISVPSNDPWYSQFGISCLDIGRSIPACGTGVREQINQVSSFLDGSHIYGSSQNEHNALRHPNGYMMLTDTNTALLPKDNQAQNCGNPASNIICFKAGDDRVNENPGLTSMHTLFIREHNRIAQILRNLNPSWTTALIFEETRRAVVAELQNVVFNEFLPAILGSTTMSNIGLNLPAPGSFSTYASNVSPMIWNEFATAAYRFGHSLIQNLFSLTGSNSLPLETSFQNPQIIYQSTANIDRLLMGSTQQPAQAYDNFVVQAVTRHLFQQPNVPFGSDLVSLNLQRGRDHGIPGWTAYRRACGLSVPTSFNDLPAIFGSTSKVDGVFDAYAVVDDIDLFTGGLHELPTSGGVVGPTFNCIISRQFKRLFDGDRFFFTHSGQTGSFRSAQLANIRSRTLGSIMCDNSQPTVTDTQSNVFLLGQSRVACSNQPKLNLNGWVAAGF
ncbi:hypothetical protein CHUAL_005498 [Chamberlinius hualienensis]